mgnify:FL=1
MNISAVLKAFMYWDWKDVVHTSFVLFIFLLCVYLLTCLHLWHTQVAVYSQDIPPNLVCIKDMFPDAYLCSPDQDVPWYLSSEGVLAHVK